MIDVPAIALFVAAVVSGFIGALVGGVLVVRSLRKGQIEVRTVELPRRIVALDTLKVSVEIKGEDDRILLKTSKDIRTHELEASVVQAWLDDNDLVAQFKGQDFKVPAPPSNPWQRTQ